MTMIHCRYPLPDDLKKQYDAIVDAYYQLDPDGDWDEAEWQEFLSSHASKELKDNLDERAKFYEEAQKRGILAM